MNDRIKTIDGLRGIAILLVLAGHAVSNYQPLEPGWRHWLLAFANAGAGVRLFFVISGYLITFLLLREQIATGTISVPRFYWRRVVRIFPAFFVYLFTLTVLNGWRPMGINLQTFVAAATFTWNVQALWVTPPPEGIWNLGHLWTLALEQQFYLLWPLALLFLGPRRALWLTLGLVVWCPIARVATYFLFPSQRGLLEMLPHLGLDSLMVGCAAAILVQNDGIRQRLATAGKLPTLAALIWLVAGTPLAGTLIRGFPAAAGITLDAVAAAWLIAWINHAPARLAKFLLGRGLLPAIGLISYSLYLWQQVFFAPGGWLAESRVMLPLACAIAAACTSYWIVEKPALRLKSRRPGVVLSSVPEPAESR